MEIYDLLRTGEPNTVGEILRAVAFPGRRDHDSAPPNHYAGKEDLRKGDEISEVRQRWLWEVALEYIQRWPEEEAQGRLDEAIRDGGAVSFAAWDVDVEALVWWDGDGTIAFFLTTEPGWSRLLVNHDSKKPQCWDEIRVPTEGDLRTMKEA